MAELHKMNNIDGANIYIVTTGAAYNDGLQDAEAERLKTVDGLLATVTEQDLMPLFVALREAGHGMRPIELLEVSCGSSTSTKALCDREGIGHMALAPSKRYLAKRPGYPHRIIQTFGEGIPL